MQELFYIVNEQVVDIIAINRVDIRTAVKRPKERAII